MTPREADRIAAFIWKDMGERRGFETLKEVTHETEVAIKSFWIEKFLALSPDQTPAPKQVPLFETERRIDFTSPEYDAAMAKLAEAGTLQPALAGFFAPAATEVADI